MMTKAARFHHVAASIDDDLDGHIDFDLGLSGLGRVGHRAA